MLEAACRLVGDGQLFAPNGLKINLRSRNRAKRAREPFAWRLSIRLLAPI